MLPIDKLLTTLLDKQFEVAETNSLTKVSNCTSPCCTRMASAAKRLTM